VACRNYRYKHNKPVWTYTHAWKRVPREAWGMSISVFASCETPKECVEARANGYAAAFIPLDIKKDRQILRKEHGLSSVLCPHFSRNTQCINCRLCFNDFAFYEKGRVLLLPPHGSGTRKVENVLRIKRNIPSI
jgi:hypothetical protein